MAQTQPSARPQPVTLANRHHAQQARQSATRVKAYAEQILLDLSRGRVVRANGRQIAADALALCEALAAMTATAGDSAPVAAAAYKSAARKGAA